jgi:hypothetical protein
MSTTAAEGTLLERDAEVAAVRAALLQARDGAGGVLWVEAPAGQGKTALLRSLRAEAAALGVRVLSATGAQIERDFAFGLVRQLFEGELLTAGAGRRDQLLAGAAALAAPVFAAEHGPTETTDVSHARLHGLFWLTANLADAGPLALVVDDAHWGDAASLRFLDVLARRIEDVPVVLAIGARPSEPGAEQDLLDGIASGAAVRVLRPAALSAGAISGLVRDTLGEDVDPGFTRACVDATAGNPLLVRELLRTLAAEEVRGRADEAPLVRRAVPGTITRTVVSRLRRLSPESLATARAVAVLGDDARLGTVAELAGLSPEAAAAAHTGLVRVGLLADEGLRFVHPMVAQAVHADLVGAERGRSHRRAAGLLAASGARADRIAVHLLHTDPEGDGWAADVLTAAGRRALSDGAPDTALRLLARAMEEPPDEAARPALALHLGLALARAGQGAGALQHLDEAIEHGDVAVVAHAARLRGNLLVMLGRAGEASASMRAPLAAVAAQDPELAAGLEDDLLGTLPYRLGDLGSIASAWRRASSRRGRPCWRTCASAGRCGAHRRRRWSTSRGGRWPTGRWSARWPTSASRRPTSSRRCTSSRPPARRSTSCASAWTPSAGRAHAWRRAPCPSWSTSGTGSSATCAARRPMPGAGWPSARTSGPSAQR